MKKADWILGAAVLAVCAVLFGARLFLQKNGGSVTVELNGSPIGTYALQENREIAVGEGNCVRIENGAAYMAEADCPDHLCMKQGKIRRTGEMIVCLPNRVTVQVNEGEEAAVDGIAQ